MKLNHILIFDRNVNKGVDVDFVERNGEIEVLHIDPLKGSDVNGYEF